MKHLLIVIYLMIATLNAAYADEKCKGIVAKLKKECNIVGKSMDKMKEFSDKNKTIGQSLGISDKDSKKKSLKEFSKENKTIDQTYKNIKEKLKKKDGN